MASIASKFALMTFLLAALLVIVTAEEDDPLALAPLADFDLPPISETPSSSPVPEPNIAFAPNDVDFSGFSTSHDLLSFLRQCGINADIDPDCGLRLVASVFGQYALKPSQECCHKIVKPGKLCYELLLKFILRFEGKGYSHGRGYVTRRSENVWKHCSKV